MLLIGLEHEGRHDKNNGRTRHANHDGRSVRARRQSSSLKNRAITSFKDLANIAPSIDINGGIPNGGGSATQIFIRGVGQDDYSFPNEPGVGLYVDGVYITRSVGGDFGFMDIERVEILRGPQGKLYGKNTIGGAIKIVTKKPTGETGGRVEAIYGSFNRLDISGVADFKINDKLFGKLAVTSRDRDGLGKNFIGQDLGSENKKAARLTLRALPTENVEVVLITEYRWRTSARSGSTRSAPSRGKRQSRARPATL